MSKKFEPVEFTFGEKYLPTLKKAMEVTEQTTMIRNDSIEFSDYGFKIVRETDEHFLFSFAWNYGKLLIKDGIVKE